MIWLQVDEWGYLFSLLAPFDGDYVGLSDIYFSRNIVQPNNVDDDCHRVSNIDRLKLDRESFLAKLFGGICFHAFSVK